MSTTALAPASWDDDFRAWQSELDTAALEPLTGPRLPQHPSRAAEHRAAQAQIDEGVAEWLRTHGFRVTGPPSRLLPRRCTSASRR